MAETNLTAEDLARIEHQSRRYFRDRAFKDGFNLAGIATSALSLTFLIIDLGNLDVAEILRAVYGQFQAIASAVYLLLLGWIDVDVPAWGPAALTAYGVMGMTAARSALIYFTGGAGVTRGDIGFDFFAGKYMNFVGDVARWTGPFRAPFVIALIAPIWPYTLINGHESITMSRNGIVVLEYRKLFMPILAATLLGTATLTITNTALAAYSPDAVAARGQVSIVAVAYRNANMRLGPSTQTAIVLVIPGGASVRVLAARDDGWSEVEYEGRRGFVATRLLVAAKP